MKRTILFLLIALATFGISQVHAQTSDAFNELKTNQSQPIRFAADLDLEKNQFDHESRLGVVLSTGNTKSLLLNANSTTLYRIKRFENKFRFGALFNKLYDSRNVVLTPGVLSKYIFGTYRLDYYFLPRTSFFVGGGGYTDEIKGIDVAGQGFGGISHYFVMTEWTQLRGSLGYEYSFEDRSASPSASVHSITTEFNFLQKINERVSFQQDITFYPNVTVGSDFRLMSDSLLKVSLWKHFTANLGYHIRFDNQPVPGFKKLDSISDASLGVVF